MVRTCSHRQSRKERGGNVSRVHREPEDIGSDRTFERSDFDSLTSLFNLLLILCGVLEYVLLGVDYHANFANVSCEDFLSLGLSLKAQSIDSYSL